MSDWADDAAAELHLEPCPHVSGGWGTDCTDCPPHRCRERERERCARVLDRWARTLDQESGGKGPGMFIAVEVRRRADDIRFPTHEGED